MANPTNPYAPPNANNVAIGQELDRYFAWQEKVKLVVQKRANLPPVCVKCGSREAVVRHNQKYWWAPQWVFLLVLISWLIAMILYFVLRKFGQLALPLCEPCFRRWRKGRIIMVLSAVGLFVLLLGGALLAAATDTPAVFFGAMVLGIVQLVVLSQVVRRRMLRVTKIDDRALWLEGVHPDAMAAICAEATH